MSNFRIILTFFAIALLGIVLSTRLSMHFTPARLTSSFTVSFSWSDRSPLLVEQKVTSILENEFSQIEGLQKIYSRSTRGSGSITLDFSSDADLAFKKIEIFTIIRRLKSDLPADLGFPVVSNGDVDSGKEEPILIYAIATGKKLTYLGEIIDQTIMPKIGSIAGIREIQLSGAANQSLHLKYDPEKLHSLNLDVNTLIDKLNRNANISFQNTLKDGNQELPVLIGEDISYFQLEGIPIDKDLTLGDLAEVSLIEQKQQYIHRINGKQAILLSLYAHDGINRISVAKEAQTIIEMLKITLPRDISVVKRYDDTTFLKEELSKAAYRSIFSILILCLFIFMFTLRWKQLIVLISVIIVNIGLALLCSYILNIEIHLYTIAGLTVSFGLLVDNSIVMLDHFTRFRNRRIISGLLAASLTTIAAIGLIFLLPAEDRQNLTDFAIIVMLSLGCSLAVSWWFTPAFAAVLKATLKKHKMPSRGLTRIYDRYHKVILWLSQRRKVLIILLVLGFGLPVYLLPAKWEGHAWYNSTLGSDYYQENIRPYVDRILGGASRQFYRNVFESSGFRDPDKTRLYMRARLPFGHTTEQMDLTLKNVESYLQAINGISVFLSYIYSGQQGQIIIEFDEDQEKGSLPYILKNKLTTKALDWGGVEWSIYGVGRGFSNTTSESLPSFRVQMKGYQFDKLKELAEIFAEKLLVHKRIQEVNANDHVSWGGRDLKELALRLNDQYLFSPPGEILQTLNEVSKLSYLEYPQSFITIGGKRVPLFIEPIRSVDFTPYYLMSYPFIGQSLNKLAKIERSIGAPEIYKENRQYLRIVSFEYFGSHRFGDNYLEEVIAEMQPLLPPGFSIEKKSWSWFSEKEKRQYSLVVLLIVIIYLICVIFFENFRQPLLIIFAIPLSFIGLFLIFAWGDFYFDQGGYAAFLMLGGLVVNAAIFIFSDYKHHRSRVQSKRVTKSTWGKAWPITLTVISTCVGLIPFLVNGDSEVFWFSLAIGMIGGLTFSTFIVLVILPVMMIQR